MKKGIHPEYRPVVFQDPSCDFAVLTRSTIKSSDTIKWTDGNTYPLVKLEISSGSHPFFTGKQKLLDTAGRVEKFQKKYATKKTSKTKLAFNRFEKSQFSGFFYFKVRIDLGFINHFFRESYLKKC